MEHRTVGLPLAVALLLIAASGCKKGEEGGDSEPGKEATAGEAEGANKVAGQALVERIDRCWGMYEAWDKESYGQCFADKPQITYIDNVPPLEVTTRAEVIMHAGAFRNAFPDFKGERVLILVNGSKSVLVARVSGTHKNNLVGIPPTGKKFSSLQGEVREHDAEGRVVRARYYMDHSTLMHQLGILESASAAAAEQPWPEQVRHVASGDAEETANLEAVKTGLIAMGKGEVERAVAMYSDDAMFRYLPEGQPYQGRQDIEERMKGYAALEAEVSIRDAWAAGDWVVAELNAKGKLAGTGDGDARGGMWELNSLELLRLADGKVVQHWTFANGLKYAADAGMFDPAAMTAGDGQ